MIDTIDFELLVILLLLVVVVVKLYLSVKRSITASIIDIIDDIRSRLVVIDKANQENKLNNQLFTLAALTKASNIHIFIRYQQATHYGEK